MKVDAQNEEKQPDSKSVEATEYEPHDFTNVKNSVSFTGAVLHIIRCSVGTGILALPFIHSRIGYISAILVTLIVGLLYFHIIHILVSTEYKLCKLTRTPKLTFMGMVDQTFENVPCKLSTILNPLVKSLIFVYYGLPTSNAMDLTLIMSNIQNIFACYGNSINGKHIASIVIFPLTALCWLRKLKYLVPFSALTNMFTLAVVCIIIGYSVNADKSAIMPTKPFGDVTFIPQSFAILLAAYRATGIYIPLKNEMKTPRTFSRPFGVVNVSACLLIMLYIIFGGVTYWSYRDRVHENVLMNLPKQDIFSMVVQILYTSALFVAYTLHFYVIFDTSWTSMLEPKMPKMKGKIVIEYVFRTGLNVMTYMMAVLIPNFALLSSISGTCGIVVEIAVPPLLDIFLTIKFSASKWWTFITVTKNLLIIIMAFSMFAASVWGCVRQLIKFYTF